MLETPVRPSLNGHQETPVRRVALVVRVSTDRQAANPEGSLKTQLQRLRQHMEYKRSVAGEEWVEVYVYELKAVSGKDSMRSAEYEKLFTAISEGRVNTVLCTALERLCRSVKDFLHFFEFLSEHGAEFVCLKQNYDTTTPQGRLFVTIMMALAEFEREQTAERTRDATLARAERGLWNGGRLLGYDLDADRKGYLIPNPDEVVLVNFAMDSYLETGSVAETREALNRAGHRTKAYTSRRGKHHPGKEFNFTSVQYLLKNTAYIGKKEVNKKGGDERRLVDAVWSGVVEQAKFERVQALLAANRRSNHNGSKPVRHTYLLSGGLLHCGRCGTRMEGRSGTGRLGVKYFYYVCRAKACALRVAADEVEGAVFDRVQELATDGTILANLVEETNLRLTNERPGLSKRRESLEKQLHDVKGQAERVLAEWSGLEAEAGRAFLTDKLSALAQRRADLEQGLAETDDALSHLAGEQVTAETVQAGLERFQDLLEVLTPFERKELVRLVLHRAEVADRHIGLEIYPVTPQEMALPQSRSRSEAPDWLPG